MAKRQKLATAESADKKHENTDTKSVRSSKSSVFSVVTAQQLQDRLKRALADYQNLEKRVEEERKLLSRLSASLLIEKLIPVLDNLENAQSHLKDEGLEIVIKQFKGILVSEGVEEIAAVGSQFNPHLHEAVEAQVGDQDNLVIKVIAKGYKIEDTVIRPAKVIISKKSAGQQIDKSKKSEEHNFQELEA